MTWVRYFEQKAEREERAGPAPAVQQSEQTMKAVLASIDQRHEAIRARRG